MSYSDTFSPLVLLRLFKHQTIKVVLTDINVTKCVPLSNLHSPDHEWALHRSTSPELWTNQSQEKTASPPRRPPSSEVQRQKPTFPSRRASPPRATRTLRGGRTKAGGSLPWELHPVAETATMETEEGAEASRTSLIVLSKRKKRKKKCQIPQSSERHKREKITYKSYNKIIKDIIKYMINIIKERIIKYIKL